MKTGFMRYGLFMCKTLKCLTMYTVYIDYNITLYIFSFTAVILEALD